MLSTLQHPSERLAECLRGYRVRFNPTRLRMRLKMNRVLGVVATLSLLAGITVIAQTKATITGTVKSAEGTPAAGVTMAVFKGSVEMPRRGGRGADPAAPPTSMPAALATGTTDDKGMYKFEGLDA